MKFEFDLNLEEFTVFYCAFNASKDALTPNPENPEVIPALKKIALKFDAYLAELGLRKP